MTIMGDSEPSMGDFTRSWAISPFLWATIQYTAGYYEPIKKRKAAQSPSVQ